VSKENLGSSIADFLKKENIFEEAQAQAIREIVAGRLTKATKRKKSSSTSIRLGKAILKRKASKSHDEAVVRELRDDPEFAAEYLRAALEDDDEPGVLLIALRRIAEARGGIAKVAKAAGIERESLYRALSVRGNPRLSTLVAVTKAVGLRLTVEAAR
jgi:probable addiction module antidote protein